MPRRKETHAKRIGEEKSKKQHSGGIQPIGCNPQPDRLEFDQKTPTDRLDLQPIGWGTAAVTNSHLKVYLLSIIIGG